MTPKEFGDELRRLREVAGISLEDVASETKISLHVLRGLEEGRFSRLPQRVFCRNFVRQIASTVGADPERLAAAFDAAWERHELSTGSHPAILVEEPPPRRVIRLWVWFPVALVVAAAAVAVLLVLRARSGGGPAAGVPGPVLAVPTAAVGDPVPEPPPPVPVTAPPEEVELLVTVRPGEECWVRVRDGLGRAEQRLLGGGGSWTYRGPAPVQLTLGNAAAAVVRLGAAVYDGLGRPGEVRHLLATPEGPEPLGGGRAGDAGESGP